MLLISPSAWKSSTSSSFLITISKDLGNEAWRQSDHWKPWLWQGGQACRDLRQIKGRHLGALTRKTLGLGSLSLISLSPDLEAPPHSGSMPVAKPMGSNEEEEVGGALDHLACSSSLLPSFPCCCCPSLPWLSARSLAGSLLPMAVSTLLSAVSLKSWWRWRLVLNDIEVGRMILKLSECYWSG